MAGGVDNQAGRVVVAAKAVDEVDAAPQVRLRGRDDREAARGRQTEEPDAIWVDISPRVEGVQADSKRVHLVVCQAFREHARRLGQHHHHAQAGERVSEVDGQVAAWQVASAEQQHDGAVAAAVTGREDLGIDRPRGIGIGGLFAGRRGGQQRRRFLGVQHVPGGQRR